MKVWHTKSGYSVSCILTGRSNVFLVTGNGKNILIDTSPAYRWGKLRKNLDNLGIRKIDYLILTHTHFDHAANASKLKSIYSATVIVNKQEADYLEKGGNTMVYSTVFITRFLTRKFAPAILAKLNYNPCKPDIIVNQQFNLEAFGYNGYILYTPGHSPGSQSVIIDDEIAIVGDSMFGVFPGSVFPPYADNTDEMIRSWGKLLETSCYLFLPSHGTPNSRKLVQKNFDKRKGSSS